MGRGASVYQTENPSVLAVDDGILGTEEDYLEYEDDDGQDDLAYVEGELVCRDRVRVDFEFIGEPHLGLGLGGRSGRKRC